MRYRQLVTIRRATEVRSPKGAVRLEYADVDGLTELPATIVPSTIETRTPGETIIQDRYDVVIAGRHGGEIRTADAVVASDDRVFEIESIDPLLGERQTRLTARLVTGPGPEVEGS